MIYHRDTEHTEFRDKILFFSILALLFITFSCSNEKSKHLIIGKWESKITPKLTLYFDEENYLRGEILSLNGHLYKYNYQYSIIDKTKVNFIDDSVGPKVVIQASINDDKMSLHCGYQRLPNEPTIVDFPTLCYYKEFTKVK